MPGRGVALLRAAYVLGSLVVAADEKVGVAIVRRACEEPVRQIANNAGHEGAVVIENIRTQGNVHYGFNAATAHYEI